jgi:hypothetical protein
MSMAVNTNEDGDLVVSSERTTNTFTITKHRRFPSLYIIETSTGMKPKALDEMFTSQPDASNFLKNYLDKMSYTTAAYANKRQLQKETLNAANTKGPSKV